MISIRLETLAERRVNGEMASDKISAAEKAQSAVDKFFADNNLGVADIETMLNEHMRPPYNHSQEQIEP